MTQKPRKGTLGSKNPKQIPGGACPQTSVEVGNRSVFILDPRLSSSVQKIYNPYFSGLVSFPEHSIGKKL